MNQNVGLFLSGTASRVRRALGATADRTYYTQIDLLDTDPIKLEMSVLDVYEPFQNASFISKTFEVPHTTTNGNYFMSVFEVNGEDFDPTLSVDAYITVDGSFFTSGKAQLISVKKNLKFHSIYYEILFTGDTSNFSTKLGGSSLCELDFGGTAATGGTGTAYGYNLNHDWTYNNVRLSCFKLPIL